MFRNLSYIIESFFFFLFGLIRKREYDVVFYYPQHFNRGANHENYFFKDLLESCEKNKISYIVFEEPDFIIRGKRNNKAVPFDFMYLLILILRKLYSNKSTVLIKDQKIGNFIGNVFFSRFTFKTYITLSQSMLSVFRGISPHANLYDLQHGIIHNNKKNYLINGVVEPNLLGNNVRLLLTGDAYKDILLANDQSNYFKSNTFVVGSYFSSLETIHQKFNNNILVTLQFTQDHSDKENEILLNEFKVFISSVDNNLDFHLRNHPRFNHEVDLSEILGFSNVYLAPVDINDCFKLCSLHISAYSTSIFEAAQYGVPSIIINPLKKFNFFNDEFKYPLDGSIADFLDITFYQESTKLVKSWSEGYYSTYNESAFLDILQ